MIDKKLSVSEFVNAYKAALKAKLNRNQLSKLLGIQPNSLVRRRLSVKREIGLDLPHLQSGNDDLSQSNIDNFNTILSNINNKTGSKDGGSSRVAGKHRFVITSAQNATPVHEGFLSTLKNYCDFNDSTLCVVPYRYKNPTSIWSENAKENEYWSPSLSEYLLSEQTRLSESMVILSQIKIQPTAVDPISGFDGYTGSDSAILGHPKVSLKTVPTSKKYPKFLISTGAVTQPNYTDSKAGFKGQHHHSLAALVVEIDGDGVTHFRHIHADELTGAFFDLDKYYSISEITENNKIAALVTGDSHVDFMDKDVKSATYTDDDSIVNTLKPEVLVFHDILDFYSRNHHHIGNDVINVGKHKFGNGNVEAELQRVADFLDEISKPKMMNLIVKSNHDEAFNKWLNSANPQYDPENSQFFHYMKYNQIKNIKKTEHGFSTIDPLEFWCYNPDAQEGLKNKNTRFLKRDENFAVNGVELSFHGDVGINGSRGNTKNFSRLSEKVVIGHSHSPGIYEGCYSVGVSASLKLEYSLSGPSSWMHTHCIVYQDGKRTLVNIIDGKWKS